MKNQNTLKTNLLAILFILTASISNAQIPGKFKLFSSAFEEGKVVPARYTCDGVDITPPLAWTGVPEKTKSFAIIMDDPDAPVGNWVHWVIYNIPATVTRIDEKKSAADIAAIDGLNSWGEKGYSGPCPPGGTHRYEYKLYALDITLSPTEGLTKEELLEKMKGHVLSEAKLTGLFRAQ